MKNYPFSFRYYLFRPWRFIEATLKNIKYARQRVIRGWSDRDTWNLDSYLLEILPEMINYLREHTHGYPGEYNGFPTPESWDNYLKEEIILPLQNAREEQTTQINEYDEEFHSYSINFVKQENGFVTLEFTEPEGLRKKWFEREKEINEWRQKELERAFAAMAKHFYSLWD